MDFVKGDIVKFKTGSPALMLVISTNRYRHIGAGQKIPVVECKWYEPSSPHANDAGFIQALFVEFELEKV